MSSSAPAPPGWKRLVQRIFDPLEEAWESPGVRRLLSRALVLVFVGSVLLIEARRREFFQDLWGFRVTTNHLQAISWTVTFLLVIELIDLVFAIGSSVTLALGKQLEVFSLVLLRKTFDELPRFEEPLVVAGHTDSLLRMGAEAGGALVIFALLIAFRRLQAKERLVATAADLQDFVAVKKLIGLLLLGGFVLSAASAGLESITLTETDAPLSLGFFETFYTVLIFGDILIVLASMSVMPGYHLVFRNFAFAIVTVMIRLGLAAKPYLNAVLGIGAAAFALGTAYVFLLAARADRERSGLD